MALKARKLIGSRAFYGMLLSVVIPIIIQNAITNFVSLLDNLMVGRVGTEQMSGVAIANQLVFVFNLGVFGAISGAGIFSAQYFGAGDLEGVRAAFRYKLYFCLLICALSIALFLSRGEFLISLYLNDSSNPARVQSTLNYGMAYLRVIAVGLVPFGVSLCYAGTLRETGETRLPMFASIAAVLVNLLFNYLLIFGKLGFPCLGVRGAAIATVLSRYVELAIIVVYTHTHASRHSFAKGLYRTLRIPARIVRAVTRKGLPLLANELLWGLAMSTLVGIYSLRGLDVVAALNISSTVSNLFGVVFISMGSACAIIIGQTLGANDIELSKDYSWKLIAFAVVVSAAVSAVLIAVSHAIPLLYNTTPSVRLLASRLIIICACVMPIDAFINCSYFILRSGGKTFITFLFDSVFCWVVFIPIALAMTRLTQANVVIIYLCVQLSMIFKMLLGYVMVKRGLWIHNIVSDEKMRAG